MPQLASASKLDLPHQGEQGAELPRVGALFGQGRLPACLQRPQTGEEEPWTTTTRDGDGVGRSGCS